LEIRTAAQLKSDDVRKARVWLPNA
jgi:hypothetical protein